MEMHSLESLRRVHGIDARPERGPIATHKLSISECHAMAGRLRGAFYRRIFSRAARGLACFARETVLHPITQRLRMRRDIEVLNRLSDRQLRDIGLNRSDIGDAVRYRKFPDK